MYLLFLNITIVYLDTSLNVTMVYLDTSLNITMIYLDASFKYYKYLNVSVILQLSRYQF